MLLIDGFLSNMLQILEGVLLGLRNNEININYIKSNNFLKIWQNWNPRSDWKIVETQKI